MMYFISDSILLLGYSSKFFKPITQVNSMVFIHNVI